MCAYDTGSHISNEKRPKVIRTSKPDAQQINAAFPHIITFHLLCRNLFCGSLTSMKRKEADHCECEDGHPPTSSVLGADLQGVDLKQGAENMIHLRVLEGTIVSSLTQSKEVLRGHAGILRTCVGRSLCLTSGLISVVRTTEQ